MTGLGWTRADWDRLATLFEPIPKAIPGESWHSLEPYSGYKSAVVEAPNGDTKVCDRCHGLGEQHGPGGSMIPCPDCKGSGRVPNTDAAGACGCCLERGHGYPSAYADCPACHGTGRVQGKRYLHVADKYPDAPAWARAYQDQAYAHACRVAEALGVPAAYFPRPSTGALRVLEYPAGAGSVEHTDANLFTVLCWRETPADLEICNPAWSIGGPRNWHPTIAGRLTNDAEALIRGREKAHALSPGLHIGELGELVGLGPATPHRVPARPYVQRALVYFAIPDHAAFLPGVCAHRAGKDSHECPCRGSTVGEWLRERMARSRYT